MRPNTTTRQFVLLSLLVLGMTVFAVPISGAAPNGSENTSAVSAVNESASKAKAASNTHTLVIKATGKPVTYTVSVSKKIRISSNNNESIDSVQGMSVTGRVGGKRGKHKDTTDVVTYRGYIESFQAQGNNVRVFLDGKRVPPSVLAGNHIKISSSKNKSKEKSQSTKYKIPVSGRAIPGESTSKQDMVKNGTIRGQVSGNSDSFYYTGNIMSVLTDKEAIVFVNGRKFTIDENKNPQTLTSSQTAPSTGAPETATDSHPITANPITANPITANSSSGDPPSNGGSGSSSGSGFIYGLVGGVVAVGLVIFGTILYFRPRKRRW